MPRFEGILPLSTPPPPCQRDSGGRGARTVRFVSGPFEVCVHGAGRRCRVYGTRVIKGTRLFVDCASVAEASAFVEGRFDLQTEHGREMAQTRTYLLGTEPPLASVAPAVVRRWWTSASGHSRL